MSLELIMYIAPFLAGAVTWFFTKRHMDKKELMSKDVEISGSQSDVMEKNVNLYQVLLDDLERRYETNIKKRDSRIVILEAKIKELNDFIEVIQREREEEINEMELMIRALKEKLNE